MQKIFYGFISKSKTLKGQARLKNFGLIFRKPKFHYWVDNPNRLTEYVLSITALIMGLEIETREKNVIRTFTPKKSSLPLSKLLSIAKKGFPGVPPSRIKVIGGRPMKLGEAIALNHAKNSAD